MDIYETLSIDSSRNVANVIIEYIGENEDLFKEVFYLSMSSPSPINWRGIRALYLCVDKNPQFVLVIADDIVSALKNNHKPALERGLLRILIANVSEEYDSGFGFLLEYCYKKMTSAFEEIAIKVYALEIIYQITQFEPELKPELEMILQDLMLEEFKPAFQSRGKRILKKLNKQLTTKNYYS